MTTESDIKKLNITGYTSQIIEVLSDGSIKDSTFDFPTDEVDPWIKQHYEREFLYDEGGAECWITSRKESADPSLPLYFIVVSLGNEVLFITAKSKAAGFIAQSKALRMVKDAVILMGIQEKNALV